MWFRIMIASKFLFWSLLQAFEIGIEDHGDVGHCGSEGCSWCAAHDGWQHNLRSFRLHGQAGEGCRFGWSSAEHIHRVHATVRSTTWVCTVYWNYNTIRSTCWLYRMKPFNVFEYDRMIQDDYPWSLSKALVGKSRPALQLHSYIVLAHCCAMLRQKDGSFMKCHCHVGPRLFCVLYALSLVHRMNRTSILVHDFS